MVHYTSSLSKYAMTLDGFRWQPSSGKHTSAYKLKARKKRMRRVVLQRKGVATSCETFAEGLRRKAHAALKLSSLAQVRARELFRMADETDPPDPFSFVNMEACVVAQ